jgi:hypothetical protein
MREHERARESMREHTPDLLCPAVIAGERAPRAAWYCSSTEFALEHRRHRADDDG